MTVAKIATHKEGFMSSIQSNKDKILEKIDEKRNEVWRKLERNADGYNALNLTTKMRTLDTLKSSISSIDLETPPDTQRYLDTDDKFLNAAYHEVVLAKENPGILEGSVAGLGEEGRDGAIEEIMDYIKSLV